MASSTFPAPDELEALVAELCGSHGFCVFRSLYSNDFGNLQVILHSKRLAIEIVRDRSQWFVEVGPVHLADLRCPLRLLQPVAPHSTPSPLLPDTPLDEFAAFILANLDWMEDALSERNARTTMACIGHPAGHRPDRS